MTADLDVDSALPMVRPGDASVAAPFTSRSPSVRNIVDLIRQGRCTLLSALQQQQIMMLESLISAYVLSALSLEGARSSERQMIASSWLLMIAQLAFSYATPIQQMHPQRPLRSLFHPAICISMFGQAAIHLYAMKTAVDMARDEMGPEKLHQVVEFHRRERIRELRVEAQAQAEEEGDWMAGAMAMWTTPFMPNLLNTCVFLVETSQCIAVLLVNYKGRPWMKGLTENHALFLSVFACVAGCAACAWGMFPELNELIHLEAFPNDEFRWKVMTLVGMSIVGTFVWDRLCVALFAPRIFGAMLDEARNTTLADMMPAVMSLGKVLGVMVLLGSGNLLLMGMAFMAYKRLTAPPPAQNA
jgi:cation-transporting ATPase 13A1